MIQKRNGGDLSRGGKRCISESSHRHTHPHWVQRESHRQSWGQKAQNLPGPSLSLEKGGTGLESPFSLPEGKGGGWGKEGRVE